MSELQNATNTGITEGEQKLLEVLLNPENRMKSITDICNTAGMSRQTYYRAFSKPEFSAVYKEKAKELVKQSVVPVINTFIREAQRGSFQHGKVILEMADMYADKVSVSGTVEHTFEAELAELIKKEKENKA